MKNATPFLDTSAHFDRRKCTGHVDQLRVRKPGNPKPLIQLQLHVEENNVEPSMRE